MPKPSFRFKQFVVQQDKCPMKVSTDAVLFGAWVDHAGATRILDIGAGTGVLSLIAAQRNSEATIHAVEIDGAAAEQAHSNFADSPWSDRLTIHHADMRAWQGTEVYDLIMCNPPYYDRYLGPQDERVGIAKHSRTLDLADLLLVIAERLRTDGRCAVILPLVREQEFLELAGKQGLSPTRKCTVAYVKHRPAKRVLLELKRGTQQTREEELVVEATGPFDYSPEYRALIADLMVSF